MDPRHVAFVDGALEAFRHLGLSDEVADAFFKQSGLPIFDGETSQPIRKAQVVEDAEAKKKLIEPEEAKKRVQERPQCK